MTTFVIMKWITPFAIQLASIKSHGGRLLLLGVVGILNLDLARAQAPTIQDCAGAIPICTAIYEESQSPSGSGNYENEINGLSNGGISCMDAELNSIWYTFTVNNSGEFGFELTPNDPNDDYDWALFDITHASCSDIFNDPSLQVSCNAAGSGPEDGFQCNGPTGATGKSNHSNQGGGCGVFPPSQILGQNQHNALVPVIAGNTYVLVVSNWTGSKNGYKIDFGLSNDIDIFDDIPPAPLDTGLLDHCGQGTITIPFTENLQLGSVTSDNFLISGPGGVHNVIVSSSASRNGGDYDKFFELALDPPISVPGEYTLVIKRNGDTDLLDLCGNQLASDTEPLSFTVANVPVAPLIFRDTTICVGSSLTLDVTDPQAESYLWADGNTDPIRMISEAGSYEVTISNGCGSTTDAIRISMANCSACEIYVPNAISPNGDGLNDKLDIFSDCDLQELDLKVFNRWGNLVYTNSGSDVTWDGYRDGSLSDAGVYVYQIQYTVQELGAVFRKTLSGDFIILR